MSTTAAPATPVRPPRREIPRGVAAVIGVLAVGAAVGVGHLVAAIVSPASSPYLAVGDTVIRFSPEWLTEFAKAAFGTADKPVLLAGMAVVIAGVAAAAGIAARRRPTAGIAVVTVLGLLGFLAVVVAPVFAPLDLLAPAVSLAAGIGAFRWLHASALRRADDGGRAGAGGVSRAVRCSSDRRPRWGWAPWPQVAPGCCSAAAWASRGLR